jgi:hypothetical protein
LCELAQVLVGICEEIDIRNLIVAAFRDESVLFSQASQADLILRKIRCEKRKFRKGVGGVSTALAE